MCEIEYFVETHLWKLCVILRSLNILLETDHHHPVDPDSNTSVVIRGVADLYP